MFSVIEILIKDGSMDMSKPLFLFETSEVTINTNLIATLSETKTYLNENKYTVKYRTISMVNGIKYNITEKQYDKLTSVLTYLNY